MDVFLMKPKIDFAFEEIMMDEKARTGFLCTVLHLKPKDVKKTQILNPYLRKIHEDDKLGILDVRILMNNDTVIDTEIQLSELLVWPDRSLFYAAKMYTDQIEQGQKYNVLKKCVSISILDFILFKDKTDFYSCFHIREDTHGFLYTNKMEFHVIELPKLPAGLKEDCTELELWAKFINAERKEDFDMLAGIQSTKTYVSGWMLFLYPFVTPFLGCELKKGGGYHMATAKYTKGKDGYFQAKVWDGTYTENGTKHRVTLRTKKSSRALEEMVKDMEEKVKNRNVLKESKISVPEYAKTWLEIYKHDTELNTKAMYPFLQEYCKCLHQSRLFYTTGKNIMTKSSYVKLWAGIQKQMGSPTLTAHIFRHNYCTNLCYQIPTISIKKIAELLGDNEKMVIEVYNHIILEKEDAQKAVEQALNA